MRGSRGWRASPASTTARSYDRSASWVSSARARRRRPPSDGRMHNDSPVWRPRAQSPTSFPRARRSVDIRLGLLRPRDRARVAELLVSTEVFSREEIDVALQLFDDTVVE